MNQNYKEYMLYMKDVTDKYIEITSQNLYPQRFCGEMLDGPEEPTEEELNQYYRENSKLALDWLKNNLKNYNDWMLYKSCGLKLPSPNCNLLWGDIKI